MNQKQIIELSQVTTGYLTSRNQHIVSRDINLKASSGELITLMGPNGAGKSTLMQTIAGLIKPISGDIRLLGVNGQNLSNKERAKMMSLVLTERIEHPTLTVWDIVTTGRYPYLGLRGRLSSSDIEILRRNLELCRLADMADRAFAELSDGEKQRVMIARALTQETPLMLLDEPTAHLDLPSRLEVLTMLRQMARELDKCILVSTHELDLAIRWADGIWLLDKQGSVCSGAPEDLILSGDIERVFRNDRLDFDPTTGEFRLLTEYQKEIGLSAEGLPYIWAQRALQRMGYIIKPNKTEAIPFVQKTHDGWLLSINGQKLSASNMSELQRLLYQYYPS